jgi:hypothetical protein
MGVQAANYSGGGSEFDAVFDIDGIRMLGEVEGKDHTAINIDKLSQLERNIGEDFSRDDVKEHAKGVLFGNPQRLVQPRERKLDFTEKCFASAVRNDLALVLTASMFAPAAYLEANTDAEYASACRAALLRSHGAIVAFPEPPSTIASDAAVTAEDSSKPASAPGGSLTGQKL